MKSHAFFDEVWQYTLEYRVKHFITYYRRMGWQVLPEDLLEMCMEECEEWNDFGWRTLAGART